jgi:hypothetical protein
MQQSWNLGNTALGVAIIFRQSTFNRYTETNSVSVKASFP